MPSESDPARLLVLVRDLLLSSRIRAEAQALNVSLQMLRDPQRLSGAQGRRLIVDLNQPAALEAAVEWKRQTGGEVIGFVSHVDTQTIQSARTAGIDQVLPRSRFVEQLPELLR